MTAPQAAGVIHSDFERGFIRAETVMVNNTNTGSFYEHCSSCLYILPSNYKGGKSEYVLVSYSLFHVV